MTLEVITIINSVNDILLSSGLNYTISSLCQCNSKLFLDLHNFLVGSTLGYHPGMKEKEKCQFIVNALERYLSPVIKLEHIQGSSLATKEESALIDLLNIFLVLWTTSGKCKSCLQVSGSVSSLSMPSPSSANASCKARLHSTPCVRTPPRVFSDATVTDFTKSGYHFPRGMCDTKQYSEASTSDMSFSTYNDEDTDDDDDDSNDAYGNTLTKLFLGYIEDFNSVSPHREEMRVKSAKLPTAVPGKDLLQLVSDQFPHIYVSPSTLRVLQQKQSQQAVLHRQPNMSMPNDVSKKVEQMQQKYKALQSLVQKDLLHAFNMQQLKLQREQEQGVKNALRSSRMAAAKAKKYYKEYESALRSKLQVQRTKEEQTFIRAFHDNLKLQKEKERQRLKYIKEKHALLELKMCDYLDSMEKCYNDQFSMLTDDALKEVTPLTLQILKSKELKEVEKEIQQLQDALLFRRDDVQHFREVDAEHFPKLHRQ